MSEDKLEELFKLGSLYEILNKAQELIEINGLMGGSGTWECDSIDNVKYEVYKEIERLKEDLQSR